MTVAALSTTVWTRLENQYSTPWLTSRPKNSAMITAGATADRAKVTTKRRCSRTPASRARGPNSFTTRRAATPASTRMTARLAVSRVRTERLGACRGRVAGAPMVRNTATAVTRPVKTNATPNT